MRSSFIWFFTIFFTLYGLINGYIFSGGFRALPRGSKWRLWYAIFFWLFPAAFLVGRWLESCCISSASSLLVWMGSYWLGALLYLFLATLIADVWRLARRLAGRKRDNAPAAERFRLRIAAVIVAVVGIALISGHINSRFPAVRTIEININKPAEHIKELTIALASDIHLGTIIGRGRIDRIVNVINELKPDVILLAGDVLDEDTGPVIRQNLGESLRQLQAPLGVYAITGNHEYIGGAEDAVAYLTEHGIRVLRDEMTIIDGVIQLVGREDRSMPRFTGRERLPLTDLLGSADTRLPLIVLDHQPYDLDEAADNGVDLQLSGHTHNGQLWPLNYIITKIYEIGYGYGRKGAAQFYVSCGAGTWGPPVRLGHRPEIARLILTFGQPPADTP